MKYFIDFEFLEGDIPCQIKGFNIPKWLIKPNNTIQPISVGICSSDGREYYAISKDFNLKEAWNRYDIKKEWYSIDESTQSTRDIKVYWIRDNVLKPIFYELHLKDLNISYKAKDILQNQIDKLFTYKEFKRLLNKYSKTNKQIAEEIKEFCSIGSVISNNGYNVKHYKEYNDSVDTWIKVETIEKNNPIHYDNKPQFCGYYCDYDWVVFCWLFGKMIDLPTGFPELCIDLKQLLDDKVSNMEFRKQKSGDINDYEVVKGSTNLQQFLDLVKGEGLVNGTYPKQTNEHNALADARFNRDLFNFLNTI